MAKKSRLRKKLTRRQQRDLDIEIGFLERIVERDPKYAEALQILGDDYTQRGKFDSGLTIDRRLARLRPKDPCVLYNLACSYALTRSVDQALRALQRAIEMGYCDFRWLARDPDLASVRKHPSYRKIQSKIRSARLQLI